MSDRRPLPDTIIIHCVRQGLAKCALKFHRDESERNHVISPLKQTSMATSVLSIPCPNLFSVSLVEIMQRLNVIERFEMTMSVNERFLLHKM